MPSYFVVVNCATDNVFTRIIHGADDAFEAAVVAATTEPESEVPAHSEVAVIDMASKEVEFFREDFNACRIKMQAEALQNEDCESEFWMSALTIAGAAIAITIISVIIYFTVGDWTCSR